MQTLEELRELLDLEQLEHNIFRGQNYQAPWQRVFGGQVLAQSLNAAYRTVPDERTAHSIHAYFILPGDISVPIIYDVERIRDGGSFTTRRVVAIQKGRPIFNMAASFQLSQEGLDHQLPMPDVPPPDGLKTDVEILESLEGDIPKLLRGALIPRPVEFRPVERLEALAQAPHWHIWMRAKGELPMDKRLHQQLFTYASDYNLLYTALLPHGDEIEKQMPQLASLDHALWFHRPFRFDEWLLFALESPSASGARGFSRGSLFTRNGTLVASVAQEGLMRLKK